MTQMTFEMEGVEEPVEQLTATADTAQWRALHLQVINWGGFQGHTQVAFAPGATLLSGASGTGKSTLMDAYLALMMPSDVPFNGASNDATSGRARGVDQRNVVTYLRGKTDAHREAGTGEMRDRVLRGENSNTWGAVGMTFVSDTGMKFTALRCYYLPRGGSVFSDVISKMVTFDNDLDLRELEPVSAAKFDKRALETAIPGARVHPTYNAFSDVLFARLGIGANGDGKKALRLLARIQAGQQVTDVDGLYKSLVLEEPGTYAAADRALAHFADLEASYASMQNEAEKSKALAALPKLRETLARATADAALVEDIIGGPSSPLAVWQNRTEAGLIDNVLSANAENTDTQLRLLRAAAEDEAAFAGQLAENQEAQRNNGGNELGRLRTELETLRARLPRVAELRGAFDDRAAVIDTVVETEEDFNAATAAARVFLAGYDRRERLLAQEKEEIGKERYPVMDRASKLTAERASLQSRKGLVPVQLHEARLRFAAAAGIDPDDLPFVAELIDVAAGEEKWRTAAEVTLSPVSRIMLVDETELERFSRAIDPIRDTARIRFEGVPRRAYRHVNGVPGRVSGKLVFKDSPFSHWVQARVRDASLDALCVDSSADLGGGGYRVTLSGQTRDGRSGAHGGAGRPILGFSNKGRIAAITEELEACEAELTDYAGRLEDIDAAARRLRDFRSSHEYILAREWADIDVTSVEDGIARVQAEEQRILGSSDILTQLREKEEELNGQLDEARGRRYTAKSQVDQLADEEARLTLRRQELLLVSEQLRADAAELSDVHNGFLTAHFAAVGNPESLTDFGGNIKRMMDKLNADQDSCLREAKRATEALTGLFESYLDRWDDPNLGTTMASVEDFQTIYDDIVTTGLHDRRREWVRRLAEWSGQDLVPLNGAFETSVEEIQSRLVPVNAILSTLAFGAGRDRLKIDLRLLSSDRVGAFRKELRELSSGATRGLTEAQVDAQFQRLRQFMNRIRKSDDGGRHGERDTFLDVRRHVEITAVSIDAQGQQLATYSSLGGKSGGESQELVAFIVGAALRFQLGDESRTRPRFAPVFLDEGFVKSDSEFAGRSVEAWKGLGFQLLIGAPLDKVTALEPYADLALSMTKNPVTGYSYVQEVRSVPRPGV